MNDIGVIHLTDGSFTIVDADLFEELNQHKWWKTSQGYVARREGPRGKNKVIVLHRLINKTPIGIPTDHANRCRIDNRRSNLRTASHSQNQFNHSKLKNSIGSKFKGVCFDKVTGRWASKISSGGKTTWLGRFASERDAAIAYNGAAALIHGEFALLNEV